MAGIFLADRYKYDQLSINLTTRIKMIHRQIIRWAVAIAILLSLGSGIANQLPTAIDSGPAEEVIELLPASNRDPALRRAARNIDNEMGLDQVVTLAQRYLQQLRLDGDPHLAGRAEALLMREAVKDHPTARLLLADLYQHQHRFDQAQALLMRLHQEQPDNQSALILSANIHRVQGSLPAAQEACERAASIRQTAATLLCAADLQQLKYGGDVYAQVAPKIDSTGKDSADPTVAVWLADLADRSGRSGEAERHFREALFLGPSPFIVDRYVRYLLKSEQPLMASRVNEWWAGKRPDPTALITLNRALIAQALFKAGQIEEDELNRLVNEFDSRWGRFNEVLGTVHWRELARFSLAFEEYHSNALDYANRNWATQKEPIDALLLAQAALLHKSTETTARLRTELRSFEMLGISTELQAAGLL